jgi:TPR repeat protein
MLIFRKPAVKSSRCALAAAALLLFGIVSPGHAGLDDGLAAYHRGDMNAAIAEFNPSAEAGDPRAQYLIGVIYLNEMAEPPDPEAAVRWLSRSAKQDYLPAQNELARLYRIGFGVEQDYTQMVYWYRRAAEQGDVGAQLFLADAYAYGGGDGFEPDLVEAYMWYEIAIQYWGMLVEPARQAVGEKMTAEQIKTAARRAEEWIGTRSN